MIRQSKPLSYPIGTIPPSSTSGNLLPSSSSSQPSPAGHSTTPSSNQMMVMLPLHGGNNTSGAGAGVGSSASGAHLVSTDDVISMLQQQHIIQVPLFIHFLVIAFEMVFSSILEKYNNIFHMICREKIILFKLSYGKIICFILLR